MTNTKQFRDQAYINGQWVDAANGKKFDVTSEYPRSVRRGVGGCRCECGVVAVTHRAVPVTSVVPKPRTRSSLSPPTPACGWIRS